MKRKPQLLFFIFAVVALLAFGFWPLSTKKLEITFDQEKIGQKKAFLNSIENDSAAKPNIVIIIADDLGKTDISLYGNPPIQTPNMDAIGQKGMTFTEGYITSPICAPSRAGMLTGRYQQRFGFEYQPHDRYPKNRIEMFVYKHFIATGDWLVADQIEFPRFEDVVKNGMPPSELMLSEILQRKGYRTGIAGKWHLGVGEHAIPINRGFDYQYGFYEAYSLYMADTSDPNIINQRHKDFSDPFIWGKGRTGNCAIRRNDQVIDEKYYLTDRIAEEAKQFIDKNQDGPFFLYVPFLAPHTPFQATKDYYDKLGHIKDRNKRVYNAMIWQLDDAVGSIIQHLKSLGLMDNTIIFFLSDNGGATYTGATDNAPLKGGKFTNFEGGLNVPFMVRWDGKVKPGSHYDKSVVSMDIFATALQLAGVPYTIDRKLDGVSLLPVLTDSFTLPIHEQLCWRSGYNRAIRMGDWKLITDDLSGNHALYNISEDKEEQHNLYESKPEIVKQLLNQHALWEAEMIDPKWPYVMDYRWWNGNEPYYFPL
ncbi:MAG: sulfatase-like hydrolase/transferase [Flavobacteriales bacterium]|nr:sulfatase-like hydrolase/transferase [Flavobacteriales bacterium]